MLELFKHFKPAYYWMWLWFVLGQLAWWVPVLLIFENQGYTNAMVLTGATWGMWCLAHILIIMGNTD